jgi:hypothetical protein
MKARDAAVAPNPSETGTGHPDAPLLKYVPLLAWVAVICTLLAIPLRILTYGFIADGDARRHVAHVYTDKSYAQIIKMRPEYTIDHSPGWEWLLRQLHHFAGWDTDALMSFSIVALMLCVLCAPLPWLRRPEAWLAALLSEMLAIPEIMTRWSQARPFLFSEGILIALLFSWSALDAKKPSALKLTLTCLGIALSVWMHGAWYLWVLPVMAFFFARAWQSALWFSACTVAGVMAGAIFTGSPVQFLHTAIFMASTISQEHAPQWMLVGEFRPSYGEFNSLVVVALVILWRKWHRRESLNLMRQPVFCLFVLCWVFCFKADRFWADWGMPAALVWLTLQFEEILPTLYPAESLQRIAACGLVAVPLFLHTTNDLDRRYTSNQNQFFLDGQDPALAGWVPGAGGIFYSAQMDFFYNTFYKNPAADWRYILGMEPALMPEDDLKILRNIQRNRFAFKAFEPWADKLRPKDRLVIESAGKPYLSQLEWTNAVGDIWIGRPPQK